MMGIVLVVSLLVVAIPWLVLLTKQGGGVVLRGIWVPIGSIWVVRCSGVVVWGYGVIGTTVIWCICGAFSYLAIGGDKGVFAPWDFFEDTISQVLHEHLFLALHIFNYYVLDGNVRMMLECMLIFHDAGSALLIPHFYKYSPKDRMRGIRVWLGWQLPYCF